MLESTECHAPRWPGQSHSVRVNLKWHRSATTNASEQRMESLWRHRSPALADKDVCLATGSLLSLYTTQSADFIALHGVYRGSAGLASVDVQATPL